MSIIEFIIKKIQSKDKVKVKQVEDESTVFEELKYVEKLCEKYLDLAKMKKRKDNTLEQTQEMIKSINKYEIIDEKTYSRIQELMDEYNKLKESKENMKNHILENSKKIEHLSHYSINEMKNIIDEISVIEEEETILKNDLEKLKIERESLKEEREAMTYMLKVITALAKSSVVFSAVVMIILLISWILDSESMILISSLGTAIFVVITASMYIYKSHLHNELKINDKKRGREIGISNKLKVKYVNVSGLLDHKYKTHGIKSVNELKTLWGKYQDTINKKSEYNKIFHEFFDIEEHLEKLLRHKGIVFDDSIDMISELSNLSEKMNLKKDANKKIENIKNEIEIIEVEQAKIADKLKKFQEEDQTEQKVVKKILKSYLKQIKNL